MHAPAMRRIFFALWPEADVRAALDRLRGAPPPRGQGRPVPARNLHLTLHFVGNVEFAAMDCMRAAAGRVRGEAFELVIERAGGFRRARVGWLAPSEAPAALTTLQRALGDALIECGFRPEARAFHPHVTVARKLARTPAESAVEALRWPVERFALIESVAVENGVEYRVAEEYPLT